MRLSSDWYEAKSPMPVGGKRGVVRTFSYQSQRRFCELLSTVDFGAMKERFGAPSWITLTFDGKGTGQDDAKPLVDYLFSKVLPRQGFGGPIIWKAELQERGVIHFHFLLWHRKSRRKLKAFLTKEWHRLTGSTQLAHLKYGVDVKKVGSTRALKCYLAKYLTKTVTKVDSGKEVGSDVEWSGRVWGVRRRWMLQFYPIEVHRAPQGFLRVVRESRSLGIQIVPFVFDRHEYFEYVESMIGRKLQYRESYYRWRKTMAHYKRVALAMVYCSYAFNLPGANLPE